MVISKVSNLHNIRKLFKRNLVPNVKIDADQEQEFVRQQIVNQKLKFKYEYEYFGVSESMQLLTFLIDQGPQWQLNGKTLRQISEMFHGRFAESVLQHKCLKYGFEFDFDSI